MKRVLLFLPLLVLALAAVAGQASQTTGASAAVGTFKVKAGAGETGYSVNDFLPSEVTIDKGSTIQWTFPWYEVHFVAMFQGAEPQGEPAVSPQPVSFPNSSNYVYSGDIFGNPQTPPTFSVTFPTEGDYTYFCGIHPNMTAKVHVKASGGQDQAAIDAAGTAELNTRLAEAKAAATTANKPATTTQLANGTTKYSLVVGADTQKGDNAQQFFPASVNVREGDTVEWKSTVFTPHNVVFGAPPQADPFEAPASPASGGSFAGGNANSTIMGAGPDYPASSYSLVFTKAGTYQYFCLLHADQGMKGTIVVAQAPATPTPSATPSPTASPTTAPRPPATGVVSGDDGGFAIAWLVAGALALALAITGGGIAVISRRS